MKTEWSAIACGVISTFLALQVFIGGLSIVAQASNADHCGKYNVDYVFWIRPAVCWMREERK
jgi:hypothetical protein